MNIFYLDKNPQQCAVEHCDKHVVKMIIEYAQLLSTAHRVLDGVLYKEKSPKGITVKRFKLDDDREQHLYKACHLNHPSAIWTRQTRVQYQWLFLLFVQCCDQYTKRYGRIHKTQSLASYLAHPPLNIDTSMRWSDPPLAMPDKYKVPSDSVQSYRNYYCGDKVAFARWTSPSEMPTWFTNNADLQIQR